MALTVGQLTAKLSLDKGTFDADVKGAGSSLGTLGQKFEGMQRKASQGMDRMVKSATENREAWNTAGTAMTAFGAATTAVGVAALKVGIDYNSLRQTATAALTSVTGSTEGAALQMKRLDDFGRNSWLMRDSLIRAQQQMTGFGIETGKVVPYMEGLAEAVAATGGNNQTFEELAQIMAKIEGQSKITAQELNEFGMRGIDAAGLIGTAMGKTGQEIRAEITDGTLDATVALDALADGMTTKFAGSTELLRNTFQGAMDNVKGAWRDLGAALATPLVDPEGGGMLVDWANNSADAIWGIEASFQGLPDVAQKGVLAIGGLTAAVPLAAGAFFLGLPRFIETKKAFGQLAEVSPRAAKGIKSVGKAAGVAGLVLVLAGAVGKLVDELTVGDVKLGANELEAAIKGISEGNLDSVNAQFDNFGTVLGMSRVGAEGLGESFDQLLDPSATDKISSFMGSLLGGVGYMNKLEERATELDAALSSMVAAGDVEQVEAFQAALEAEGYTLEEINKLLPQTKDALIGVEDATDGATSETEKAAAATEALEKAYESLESSLTAASEGFVDVGGAYDTLTEKNQELAQAVADGTDDATDSWEDYIDDFKITGKDYIAELEAQVEAQQTWQTNMVELAGKVSQETIDELIEMGPAGADAVADMVNMTDEELAGLDFATAAKNETDDFIAELLIARDDLPNLELFLETSEAVTANTALMSLLALSGESIDDWQIDADGTLALREADGTVIEIDEKSGEITILGDDTEALREAAGAVSTINDKEATIKVGAYTGGALGTINAFVNRQSGRTIPMTLVANKPVVDFAALGRGRAEGGKVGFAGGGTVPGTPPSNPKVDNILASTQNGSIYGIRSGEWIINEPASKKNDAWLNAINGGLDLNKMLGTAPGLAGGGRVTPLAPTPAANRGPVGADTSANARATPSQAVEINIYSVPTDYVDETAKALNFALRSRGGVYSLGTTR